MKIKNILITLMVLISLIGIANATGTISGITNLLFKDTTKITLETPKVNISTYDASLKLYASEHNIFGNENGESIELHAIKNDSKPYIGWFANDPNQSFNNVGVGWIGCHYDSDPVTNPPHQHCSWETLDNSTGTPLIHSKFEISWGSVETLADIKFPGSLVQFTADRQVRFSTDITKNASFNWASTGYMVLNSTSGLFLNNGNRIKSKDVLKLFPNNQTTYGLEISNQSSTNVSLNGVGVSEITFLDNISTAPNKIVIIKTNTSAISCDSSSEGGIAYWGNKHYGCDGTSWNALY